MNCPGQLFAETSAFPLFLLVVVLVVFTLIAYGVCSHSIFAEQIVEEDDDDEPERESSKSDSSVPLNVV